MIRDIQQAQEFLETNYQEKFSIESIAAKLGIGKRNFDRRFKKATGLTPLEYLQRVKKKEFENSRQNVSEVMYDVGYNDTKAFREVFN